jgi:hypothetical protein
MILAEQVTIPEGIVKGPDRVLPKNSVFKGLKTLLEGESMALF